ncbi:hypothetical protein [Kitasatospora aureofaciens]|uniref:hypothetical protein n=1 Tax=Kitasatospora aureofaciens TaxID=1894 RepID=UPI0036F46FFF
MIAYVTLFVLFAVTTGAQVHYLAGLYVCLLAAGAVVLDGWLARPTGAAAQHGDRNRRLGRAVRRGRAAGAAGLRPGLDVRHQPDLGGDPARTVRSMLSASILAAREEFTVSAVGCRSDHIRWSEPETRDDYRLVLVRRGRFRRRADGADTDLDPTIAYLGAPGEEERFAHPCGGDTCTAVTFEPSLLGRAPAATSVYVDARVHLAHRRLLAAAGSGDIEYALMEELLRLVAAAAGEPAVRPRPAEGIDVIGAPRCGGCYPQQSTGPGPFEPWKDPSPDRSLARGTSGGRPRCEASVSRGAAQLAAPADHRPDCAARPGRGRRSTVQVPTPRHPRRPNSTRTRSMSALRNAAARRARSASAPDSEADCDGATGVAAARPRARKDR